MLVCWNRPTNGVVYPCCPTIERLPWIRFCDAAVDLFLVMVAVDLFLVMVAVDLFMVMLLLISIVDSFL